MWQSVWRTRIFIVSNNQRKEKKIKMLWSFSFFKYYPFCLENKEIWLYTSLQLGFTGSCFVFFFFPQGILCNCRPYEKENSNEWLCAKRSLQWDMQLQIALISCKQMCSKQKWFWLQLHYFENTLPVSPK